LDPVSRSTIVTPSPSSNGQCAFQTNGDTQYALTGQFADKPTRGQSSRGLDDSRTSQLADSKFLKIMELLHTLFPH